MSEAEAKEEVSFPVLSVEQIRKQCIRTAAAISTGQGYVPVLVTHNGEQLSVWSVRQPHQESPVFNSYHETHILNWEVLYPTFADLFIQYVENHGLIRSGWDFGAV